MPDTETKLATSLPVQDMQSEMDGGNEMAASPGLESLPAELLSPIFSSEALDLQDLKSLSLTCRALWVHAAGVIFRRVILSPLRRDRNAFLQIADSSRLAPLVRELEWQDLPHMTPPSELFGDEKGAEIDFSRMREDFAEQTWLPNIEDSSTVPGLVTRTLRSVLFPSLDNLPALYSLVIRPMPPYRIITRLRPDMYPLMASFVHGWASFQVPEYAPSMSLLRFLGEAEHVEVRKLRWADPRAVVANICQNPAILASTCAPNLVTVHLQFDLGDQVGRPAFLTAIGNFLSGAKQLKELRLAITHKHISGLQPPLDDILNASARASLAASGHDMSHHPIWPRIQSLILVETRLSALTFLQFVRRHARTLVRLDLEDSVLLRGQLFRQLAAIPNLSLTQFRIKNDDWVTQLVDESSLLSFVNQETADFPLLDIADGDDEDSGDEQDSFDDMDPDEESDEDMNVGQTASGPHLVQEGTEDLIDKTPRLGIATCSGRYVTDGVGGLRVLDFPFPRHRAYNRLGEPESQSHQGEAEVEVDDAGSEGSCESLDSLDMRVREAPCWRWGHFMVDGTWRFAHWEVPPTSPDAYRTVLWRFTTDDDEIGYGIDPLDFWPDWDDRRRSIEPTPFCGDFFRALRVLASPKVAHPSGPHPLEAPPEGAIVHPAREAFKEETYAFEQFRFMYGPIACRNRIVMGDPSQTEAEQVWGDLAAAPMYVNLDRARTIPEPLGLWDQEDYVNTTDEEDGRETDE